MPRITGFAILLVSLSLSMVVDVRAMDLTQNNLDRAVSYLRNVAYNPELHLCREAPRVAPNVYWISSDNLLAFKALEPYDQQLSSTISSELVRLAKLYNLPTSGDGIPLSLRYDVVMRDNETLELPPRDVSHLTLYNDSYLLRYDIANGTSISNWQGYADLLLLVALSDHSQGNEANAKSNLTLAAEMWDGMGLRDQVQNRTNSYETYKLALLLYVSSKLAIPLTFEQDVINRIWLMQDQTNGGIFTHIMPDGGSGTSDTNTETTAMVILGITSVRQPIPEFDLPILVMCLDVLLCAVIIRRIRHRRFVCGATGAHTHKTTLLSENLKSSRSGTNGLDFRVSQLACTEFAAFLCWTVSTNWIERR